MKKETTREKKIWQPAKIWLDNRSHLKKRILVQVQGGPEFQPADILIVFRGVGTRAQHRNRNKRLF